MEKMGYGKQPYIVFKHNDIARKPLCYDQSIALSGYTNIKLVCGFQSNRIKFNGSIFCQFPCRR